MEDLTGKQLGSYQIVAPLGEGGMAAVYKAYHPAMDRYVALKILPRHFASDPLFVARFQQEAKVIAQLQHPHILPVHDFGEADGYTYLVMPFVQSGTLADFLIGAPLPWPQIRAAISQIGGALDYAHAHGLIHRDVKPSNVLMDESGNCLLSDFGLAKIVEGSLHLTTSGAIMGTPAYMSPEQGLGHTLDGRSDIYSLGVILYEMATGRAPYQAETPMAVMIKHISDPLPLPSTINPSIPEAVERVILKALAKNPEDRFATAGEMVRALQAAIPETAQLPSAPAETVSALAEEAVQSKATAAPVEAAQAGAPQPVVKPKAALPNWILAASDLFHAHRPAVVARRVVAGHFGERPFRFAHFGEHLAFQDELRLGDAFYINRLTTDELQRPPGDVARDAEFVFVNRRGRGRDNGSNMHRRTDAVVQRDFQRTALFLNPLVVVAHVPPLVELHRHAIRAGDERSID